MLLRKLLKKKKSSPEDMLIDFRETGREGEREEEKHGCERETSISCLLYMPRVGPIPQPRHVA